MNPPSEFFHQNIVPCRDEWRKRPLEHWIAMSAVQNVNILAEHYWRHWRTVDPRRVADAASAGAFRTHLAQYECLEFQIVRDVADAHKHVTIDRRPRGVTMSMQTGLETLGWDQGAWDEMPWDGNQALVVTLDNGSKRTLEPIVDKVIAMWRRLL